MHKYSNKKQVVEVLVDVICDCCGKSCKTQNIVGRTDFEFMTLSANWGFGSKYDMQSWSAEVCESCVTKKLKFITFKKTGMFVGKDSNKLLK